MLQFSNNFTQDSNSDRWKDKASMLTISPPRTLFDDLINNESNDDRSLRNQLWRDLNLQLHEWENRLRPQHHHSEPIFTKVIFVFASVNYFVEPGPFFSKGFKGLNVNSCFVLVLKKSFSMDMSIFTTLIYNPARFVVYLSTYLDR